MTWVVVGRSGSFVGSILEVSPRTWSPMWVSMRKRRHALAKTKLSKAAATLSAIISSTFLDRNVYFERKRLLGTNERTDARALELVLV